MRDVQSRERKRALECNMYRVRAVHLLREIRAIGVEYPYKELDGASAISGVKRTLGIHNS